MAVKNFRFVSPGIFINEIDKSQLTREFPNVGPVIIGRTKHGPAMAPIQVDSFAEFQDIFGSPVPGGVAEIFGEMVIKLLPLMPHMPHKLG